MNGFQVSRRLADVSESATLRLNALVKEMKAKGEDVINLTAGEPDLPPPAEAMAAITRALEQGQNKYTPAAGVEELRALVAQKTNRDQPQLAKTNPWKSSHVVISNGGKQALFNSFLALLNDGDEVWIPSPYWLSYPEMAKVAGARTRILKTRFEEGFRLTAQALSRELDAVSEGPRTLVLNSPSNPAGVTYGEKDLRAIGEVLLRHPRAQSTWIISDEIYDTIVFGEVRFCSFLNAVPELRDRTVTSNGMSKSASMTGWRIGWTVAPEPITQALIALQGQSTSGINSLAQAAAIAALKLPNEFYRDRAVVFQKRRDLLLEILSKCGKLKTVVPHGAFYAFVGVGARLRKDEDSVDFAERLLRDARVAVVPGTPFGAPEFVRLSFATDDRSLQEGLNRFVRYMEETPSKNS